MSTITIIHDQIYTTLSSTFTTAAELTDTNVEENDSFQLKNGYLLTVGGATKGEELKYVSRSYNRIFTITLTRQTYDVQRNSASRKSVEKQILEDKLTLIKALNNNNTLQRAILRLDYESDSGIVNVFDEKEKYISLTMEFNIEYYEQL